MRYRIRAAATVQDGDRLLLVKHVSGAASWWVPPGGGLEGQESIIDCAKREVWEEMQGLTVYPEELRNRYWERERNEGPRYLGVQVG